MKTVSSLQNPLVKEAASLQLKKYRDETGLFLVEGEAPCADAMGHGWECVSLFVIPAQAGIHALQQKDVDAGIRQHDTIEVTQEILAKISKKDNPQDVIGVFKQRLYNTPQQADFTLALEEIRDPGNLGTIMRTAHAVNVKNIILLGQCCDAYNPEVIRASMGSFSFIHLSAMTQNEFLHWRKTQKLNLIGTDVAKAVDYREADYTNAVLVMGNEQKGLSPELQAHCTTRVKIPMPGGTESLNLSIATGLLLYEANK